MDGPYVRVMYVRAQMFVFERFRGPARSFRPGTSARIGPGTSAGCPPLSDPRNRNHKSLAIANCNFEIASFSRRVAVKSQRNRSVTRFFGFAVIFFELRLQSLSICGSKSLRFGSLRSPMTSFSFVSFFLTPGQKHRPTPSRNPQPKQWPPTQIEKGSQMQDAQGR